MALDPKYAEAFVNVPHKVLGFKLRPFSLWHKFLLEFYDNPLVAGEESVSAEDVLQAIQVCRVEFPDPPKRETIWTKIRLLLFSWDQEKESENFTNYIEDYLAFPEFWDKEEEGGKTSGAPDTLTMAVQLFELGFSEADTWNMPLGKIYWYGAASAVLKGADIDFVTEEEKDMQRNKDQILADMAEAEKRMREAMTTGGTNSAEGV